MTKRNEAPTLREECTYWRAAHLLVVYGVMLVMHLTPDYGAVQLECSLRNLKPSFVAEGAFVSSANMQLFKAHTGGLRLISPRR